jgi:hypothetical protein
MKGILVLVELFFEKISKTLAKRDHVVIRGLCSKTGNPHFFQVRCQIKSELFHLLTIC